LPSVGKQADGADAEEGKGGGFGDGNCDEPIIPTWKPIWSVVGPSARVSPYINLGPIDVYVKLKSWTVRIRTRITGTS
jgi:hypothetical protein